MAGTTAGDSVLRQHPAERLAAAQRSFEQAVARFIARPQLRCNLEHLKAAAAALHDKGLGNLEHCHGREPGSFGGRMAPQSEPEKGDCSAAM